MFFCLIKNHSADFAFFCAINNAEKAGINFSAVLQAGLKKELKLKKEL